MHLHHLFERSVVETPEFQRWFAGSQIVDAEGKPLRLYHGTSKDQDFRKFRMPGNGVWFTSNPKDASTYAENNDSQGYTWDDGQYRTTHTASRVLPVYVKAVNPLRIDTLPDKLRYSNNYRAAQREWFNQLRREGYDAMVIGDTVVVLKDANQIKSAIGNMAFNPAKAGITEAAIPFGQTANATGFTFGFETEFIISGGYMIEKSWRDIDELASDEGMRLLERYFDMPDIDDAFEAWRQEHPDENLEDMLNDLGAQELLKRAGAEPNEDVRYDPETGQIAVHDKSQVDAFYDVADDLIEDVGIHPRIFNEDHARTKALDQWYLEPDMTVRGHSHLDYDAELTSKVFDDYGEFLEDLQYVFDFIGKHDTDWMYTNSTCGVHINIGPPRSFDPVKFIVFAGEDWMAKLFPRADGQSTASLIGELRDKVTFGRNFDKFIAKLTGRLKALGDKMYTVNFLPWFEGKNYAEIRVMGGAGYEKRFAEIKRHIDRLLVLFAIASDPAKYRRAYMQKVYRYFISEQPDALSTGQQTLAARQFIQYARQNRVPDWQINRFVADGRIIASPQQIFEMAYSLTIDGKAIPNTVLKLLCREIGLRQSQIDEVAGAIPISARERYAAALGPTIQQMKNCAIPG